jgi:drug/metabolite transporter (DMT)-like permease
MNRFVLRQSLLLFLTAAIWGVAFVAQSVGMEYIEPFTFNAVRSLIGAVVLLPCIQILGRGKKTTELAEGGGAPCVAKGKGFADKTLWIGGISCGVCLFVASNLQQFGILYTTVGKAGFITAMYIVIVPLLGIFIGKKTNRKIWAAVALAVAGLYLLCMTEGSLTLQKGDLLVGCCAVVFSLHILIIDYFAPKVDGVRMSCIQFLVCGLLSLVCMFLFETPELTLILQAWLPVLYAGVMSCGVAYTLQIVGQRGMNPTAASLLLSMESVVSLIAGWIILGQKMSGRELMGCGLMFLAIILAQL